MTACEGACARPRLSPHAPCQHAPSRANSPYARIRGVECGAAPWRGEVTIVRLHIVNLANLIRAAQTGYQPEQDMLEVRAQACEWPA